MNSCCSRNNIVLGARSGRRRRANLNEAYAELRPTLKNLNIWDIALENCINIVYGDSFIDIAEVDFVVIKIIFILIIEVTLQRQRGC